MGRLIVGIGRTALALTGLGIVFVLVGRLIVGVGLTALALTVNKVVLVGRFGIGLLFKTDHLHKVVVSLSHRKIELLADYVLDAHLEVVKGTRSE